MAVALGLTSAALSLYWTVGGRGLLDTVGGYAEAIAIRGGPTSVAVGAVTVTAKLAVVWVADALRRGSRSGGIRRSAMLVGVVMAVYGTALTAAGLAALGGLFGPVADQRAILWHAVLWDPWFMAWGVALWLAGRRAAGP